MAEVTVRLDDIEIYEGTAKSSGRAYTKYSLKAGGRKYVTFKREIAEPAGLLKGQVVTITYDESQNGEYTNYDLTKVESGPQEAAGATETPSQPTLDTQSQSGIILPTSSYTASPSSPTEEKKNLSIARAVALKAAVETATGLQLAEADSDAILRIANVYVSWLLNGESNPFADLQDDPEAIDLIAQAELRAEQPVDAKGELVKF